MKNVVHGIRAGEFFALMCDGTRDIAGLEQMIVCFRTVDDNFNIEEDFVGMYNLYDGTAETIFQALQDVLLRYNLDKNKMRGQSYDGAANMAGHLSGAAQRFLDAVPEAIFVHCYAHKLNLVLQDLCKGV